MSPAEIGVRLIAPRSSPVPQEVASRARLAQLQEIAANLTLNSSAAERQRVEHPARFFPADQFAEENLMKHRRVVAAITAVAAV
jgi:hypothetical protein